MLCDDSQCLAECPTPAAQFLMIVLFYVKFERGMLISAQKRGPWLRLRPPIGTIPVLHAFGVPADGSLMVRRGVRSVPELATGVTGDGGGEDPAALGRGPTLGRLLLLETLVNQLVPRFRDHVQGIIHELFGVV